MQMMERWSAAQSGGAARPFVTYYDVSTGERFPAALWAVVPAASVAVGQG